MRIPDVHELKKLFRNLEAFRSLYESHGVDELSTPEGDSWTLWDLEYLLTESKGYLTKRQYQALHLCLIQNRTEREVARMMGISETSPVAIYATQGLTSLIEHMKVGDLARFTVQNMEFDARSILNERQQAIQAIAQEIKSTLMFKRNGCWVYPLEDPLAFPTITLHSSRVEGGLVQVHPVWVMYQAMITPISLERTLHHHDSPYYWRGCVNPYHAQVRRMQPKPAELGEVARNAKAI